MITDGGPAVFEEMTWRAIRELVATGVDLAVLPVGATEQHGPHLPVSTDTDIATAICREASRHTGVPVLPTLSISSSGAHTTKWPGTLFLSGPLLIAVVVDIAKWVASSGFHKLLIVNAHVGNVGPLKVAAGEIRGQGTLRVGVCHWWELTREIAAEATSDASDWHANAAETSLMLHLRPSLVRADLIEDDPDRTQGRVLGYSVAETSVEGVTSSPSQGTAERGLSLLGRIVAALADQIECAKAESLPDLAGGRQ